MNVPPPAFTTLGEAITADVEIVDMEPLVVIEAGKALFDMDLPDAEALYLAFGAALTLARLAAEGQDARQVASV